jgi:hypothetical protein
VPAPAPQVAHIHQSVLRPTAAAGGAGSRYTNPSCASSAELHPTPPHHLQLAPMLLVAAATNSSNWRCRQQLHQPQLCKCCIICAGTRFPSGRYPSDRCCHQQQQLAVPPATTPTPAVQVLHHLRRHTLPEWHTTISRCCHQQQQLAVLAADTPTPAVQVLP